MNKKRIIIFGSTGSIGRSALRVIDLHPDRFSVAGLTAGNNFQLFLKQIKKYNPDYLYICDEQKAKRLSQLFPEKKIFSGKEGLNELSDDCPAEIAIFAISGTAALKATFTALKNKERIALANKEVLVCSGDLFNKERVHATCEVLPIDSELSAIFQCLQGQKRDALKRVILTASGGPFFNRPANKLKRVTISEALSHPTWKMGRKITIDSATMVNKALEMIETHFLFQLNPEKIDVLIHPQSIVHSLIELTDGSLLAQLSVPDMALPIQYALTYPLRAEKNNFPLQLEKVTNLQFFKPDLRRFPAIKLARFALQTGKSAPLALHIANEIAVEAFLQNRLSFQQIIPFVADFLGKCTFFQPESVEQIIEIQEHYRQQAIESLRGKK